jgi:HEAT repeats/HEAT repeat
MKSEHKERMYAIFSAAPKGYEEDAMSLDDLMIDLKKGLGMARVNAAVGLGKLKDKRAENALIEALQDKNMAVRNNAAFALGELGSRAAVPNLIDLLSVSEERVRKSAVKALGMIGAREAIDPLIRLLDSDTSRVVKKSAIRSLGQIGGPKALRAVEPFKAGTDAVLADMAKKAVETTANK